jgi:DNA polymerase/3'-5' exonuclease PolX
MSQGAQIPLTHAQSLVSSIKIAIEPYAKRVVVAGSVRRERPYVRDLDFVVEPRSKTAIESIRRAANRWGQVRLNGDKWIRVTLAGSNMPVDLFFVTPPAEWGVILAARTGPTAYWLKAKEKLHEAGLTTEHGSVRRAHSRPIPVPDEESFYRLAGMDYLPPTEREQWEADVTDITSPVV